MVNVEGKLPRTGEKAQKERKIMENVGGKQKPKMDFGGRTRRRRRRTEQEAGSARKQTNE